MTLHALYRFYDDAGSLLYIGITHNPGQRWAAHMRHKPWWSEVATIRLEEHPDRASVLAAERAAIRSEGPRYNVVGRGRSSVAPSTRRAPMLAVGKVVGLALRGGTCPVGMVAESDHKGARLNLYAWTSGHFGYGTQYVPYSKILCLRFADELSPAQKVERGHLAEQVVYDMDPLAEFQGEWGQPPRALTPEQRRHVERLLAIPGYAGPFLPDRAPF
ncbi:MAG: GIY-YIG nuclease family protein [Acidimicrobiia bacterium]